MGSHICSFLLQKEAPWTNDRGCFFFVLFFTKSIILLSFFFFFLTNKIEIKTIYLSGLWGLYGITYESCLSWPPPQTSSFLTHMFTYTRSQNDLTLSTLRVTFYPAYFTSPTVMSLFWLTLSVSSLPNKGCFLKPQALAHGICFYWTKNICCETFGFQFCI